MALVKFGGGVIGMSGKIAGNVFARNRYGNYVRAGTKPINPRTALQTEVRAAMSLMTVRWAESLSGAQRVAWNEFASNVPMTNRIGEVIKLSGYNHYLRSNTILARAGKSAIDDAPVTFEIPEADPLFAITASEGSQLMTVTYDDTLAWNAETEGYFFVFMGKPQNTQRIFFDGPWRQIGHIAGIDAGGPASPKDMGVQFAVGEGQKLWAYARILRKDGRLSQPFRAETFCTA